MNFHFKRKGNQLKAQWKKVNILESSKTVNLFVIYRKTPKMSFFNINEKLIFSMRNCNFVTSRSPWTFEYFELFESERYICSMSCVLFLTATTWLTMYCNQSVNVSRRLLARYSGKILLLLRMVKSRKPVMLAQGLNKFPIDFSLNSHRKLAYKQ